MVAVVKSSPAMGHQIETAPLPGRYARGWHCLGVADAYRDGKPHAMDIFGTRLVVFAGDSGHLNILNAWCPHMGADLGLGRIEGDALVCAFHSWRWGCDGVCTAIPYAKRIPPKARTRAWPSCEQNKLLFVWNDPEGNPPPPELAIPRIDAAYSDGWSDWSIVNWTIENNCRELVDNVADSAHFVTVHGSENVVYFADIFEGHKATQIMVGSNSRLGGKDEYLTTVATYYGPAYQITHMFGAMNGMPVESILLNSHTPIDERRFELRFGVIVKKFPGMTDEQCDQMVKGYVDLTNKAFGEDVAIWHNKVRIDNPLLCDGDGPIYQNRQWYDQFYVDAAEVPATTAERRVIEKDNGIATKPALKHAFE